jgi:small subunit ribosomal protein S2
MINELIRDMVDAGVHYGHQTKKWNPKMKPYLMKDKGGIYIIDLEKTVRCLDKASDFLSDLSGKNKKILFVGCKRQAQDAIREAAEATGQYYVNHRWLGGMLTNMTTVRKSIERLKWLENIEKQPEFKAMSKKELSALGREREKLLRNLRGIRGLEGKPDAIVIVDSARESIAVAEARRLEIPIVAIVDTNADPAVINYPIPGNDDAVRAIRIILQNLVDAIVSGVGTGGTITGIASVIKGKNPNFRAIAVEPTASPVITQTMAGQPVQPAPHKIQGIGAGFVPKNCDISLIDEVILVTNEDAFAMAQEVSIREGLAVGISAGANIWAALQLAKRPEYAGKRIVTIACSPSERYLSTALAEKVRAEVTALTAS